MRLRTAQNKLKIEHSIIEGVLEMLERLLAANPGTVRSVARGVIRRVHNASGVKVHVTVLQNGWKAIALSAGARQELSLATDTASRTVTEPVSHRATPKRHNAPERCTVARVEMILFARSG